MRTPHTLYANPASLREPRTHSMRTPHSLCEPQKPQTLRGTAHDASRLLEVLHDYGRIFLIQNATENLH